MKQPTEKELIEFLKFRDDNIVPVEFRYFLFTLVLLNILANISWEALFVNKALKIMLESYKSLKDIEIDDDIRAEVGSYITKKAPPKNPTTDN